MNKIIDCFTFFNELDLLEIRLKYLYQTVDHFVIVEADSSFNGAPKEMVFKDNIERFAPYMDKIVFVPISMKIFEDGAKVAWKREEYQRNCIQEGLNRLNLKDSDLVLISDVDEIPNKEVLIALKNNVELNNTKQQNKFALFLKLFFCFFKFLFYLMINKSTAKLKSQIKLINHILFKGFQAPLNFKMFNYYYFINNQKKDSSWSGLQCLQAKWLQLFTADEVRSFRKSPICTVTNGGWHFSYLGGKDMIKFKIKNFSHQEFNIPEIVSDEYIDFCINEGYSLFEYYKNPNIKPTYVKKEISHLPKELQTIVVDYPKFIFE